MSELIQKAKETARDLHEGKAYGKNSNMFEQIKGLVEVLDTYTTLNGKEKETLIAAAWLSKSIEHSKLAEGKNALDVQGIQALCGNDVAEIVQQLCTEEAKEKAAEKQYKADQLAKGIAEQDVKSEPKDAIWLKKSIDAQGLSHASREILMAEKQSNFINDADTSKTKKGHAWHIEYYLTRMLMVEALKDTNPQLYKNLRDLAVKGVSAHMQEAHNKEGKETSAVCLEIVRNKSNIPLTPQMEKLMQTRASLVHDAHQDAHRALNPSKEAARTTLKTATLSAEELKKMNSPAKTQGQKTLDFTNKTVFTYVYGKGVER